MRLTDSQVKEMWQEFAQGSGVEELAEKYGVSRQTAYYMLGGRARKHLGLGDGFAPQSELEKLALGGGQLVIGLREILGCTQEELARRLGRSVGSIGNWETGQAQMHLKDLRRLIGWIREIGLEPDLVEKLRPTDGQSDGHPDGHPDQEGYPANAGQ